MSRWKRLSMGSKMPPHDQMTRGPYLMGEEDLPPPDVQVLFLTQVSGIVKAFQEI